MSFTYGEVKERDLLRDIEDAEDDMRQFYFILKVGLTFIAVSVALIVAGGFGLFPELTLSLGIPLLLVSGCTSFAFYMNELTARRNVWTVLKTARRRHEDYLEDSIK